MSNRVTPKLLLATGNAHKAAEMRAILADLPVELVNLSEIDPEHTITEPEETGSTYLENALIKAKYYGQVTHMACLADDSGLEIEALDGAPGLFSHRFLSQCRTQAEKNERVLEILHNEPLEKRRAQFRCLCVIYGLDKLGVSTASKEYIQTEATCPGHIAFEAYGQGGFGYDPIFMPDLGNGRHMAELSEKDKNKISHRGQAVRQAVRLLLEKRSLK